VSAAQRIVDVGVGRLGAPVGSEEWALDLRLHLTGLAKDLPSQPKALAESIKLFCEHRGWTLVHDMHGQKFSTFETFCEHPQPWGIGRQWREVQAALVAVLGERSVELVTVAPAVEEPDTSGLKRDAGPGRGHRKTDVAPVATTVSREERSEIERSSRLRAIAEHAPVPVKDLYRSGLLGQKEAAKLGPKNPTPEEAARVTSIARDLAAEAKALDTSTEALRKQAQRALNTKARDLLGVRVDRVAEALRAVEKMNDEERARFLECVLRRWPALETR
jgi:hypothetical protein